MSEPNFREEEEKREAERLIYVLYGKQAVPRKAESVADSATFRYPLLTPSNTLLH